MSIADVMADQWRLPRAPLAEVAPRALNHRNGDLIAQTIDALDVHAGHKVLDVGFGGGLSLRLLLHKARGGQVCGVDPSVDMVKRAGRLLSTDLDSGRLALQLCLEHALEHTASEGCDCHRVASLGPSATLKTGSPRRTTTAGSCAARYRPLPETEGPRN